MPNTTIPTDQVLASSPRRVHKPTYRPGTKKAHLIDLLASAKGVTVDQIATALGWLPHTTRAALTGLKKDGVDIEKLPPLKDTTHSRYRLAREGS
jgi:predicted ArsR family transcriptional regulator